jgi:hypothetical protein
MAHQGRFPDEKSANQSVDSEFIAFAHNDRSSQPLWHANAVLPTKKVQVNPSTRNSSLSLKRGAVLSNRDLLRSKTMPQQRHFGEPEAVSLAIS